MIDVARRITAESPTQQLWKFLRYFLDVDFVAEEIRRAHRISSKNHTANLKKQARQLGYCIRQAEEYFEAARGGGLATRPVLLYYGAVSLSRALVLLRLDGTYSFDVLRQTRRHSHHGLELDRGLLAGVKPGQSPVSMFEGIECWPHTRTQTDGTVILWGHFGLFYRALQPGAVQVPMNVHDKGKSGRLESFHLQTVADLLPSEQLGTTRLNALALIKTLPDMYWPLIRDMAVRPGLCRGNVRKDVMRTWGELTPGTPQIVKVREESHFFLDGINPEEKDHFLAFYKERSPELEIADDYGENIHLKIVTESKYPAVVPIYVPDIVDDITGKPFFILRPEQYLPEAASILVVLFALSMLARYYPDIWMKALDTSPRIVDVTDSLLNVAFRKFPNLILDQLTSIKHVFEAT